MCSIWGTSLLVTAMALPKALEASEAATKVAPNFMVAMFLFRCVW
jgi:hypothetical protein